MDNSQAIQPRIPTSKQIQINPLHLIAGLSIIAIIILLIVTFVLNSNKIPEVKITNFKQYYPEMPKETKQSAQAALYSVVSLNTDDNIDISKLNATIRDGSTTGKYNQETNVYIDNFIVDIESIKQSYYLEVSWSPENDNPNLDGGYPIMATCPTTNLLIYGDFNCKDDFGSIAEQDLFSSLPMTVSYYDDNYSEYTSYYIVVKAEGDKYTLVITDYTGGNREAALNKLREANINPDEYNIEYNDYSNDYSGPAPNDALQEIIDSLY